MTVAEAVAAFYHGQTAPLPEGVPVDDDEGLTCDCHDRKPPPRGWKGKLPVPVDGNNWPLEFAAKILGASEKDLRDLIRILGIPAVGTMKMSSYRRSGRNPRAYDASLLVRVWQTVQDLRENLKDNLD